jgi:hypothetical protein
LRGSARVHERNIVEGQHRVSILKLVDTLAEQALFAI